MFEPTDVDEVPLLPESVPVVMPDLPPTLSITTIVQFKAMSESVRARILGIVQHQPATAKQIADRLDASPGAIGYHLRVLEEAGLVRLIARRSVRGIVAKYYARAARSFVFNLPEDVVGSGSVVLGLLSQAREELAVSPSLSLPDSPAEVSFPHIRLSPERAQLLQQRMRQLIADAIQEPPSPEGRVYGLCVAFFESPEYLQQFDDADVG